MIRITLIKKKFAITLLLSRAYKIYRIKHFFTIGDHKTAYGKTKLFNNKQLVEYDHIVKRHHNTDEIENACHTTI